MCSTPLKKGHVFLANFASHISTSHHREPSLIMGIGGTGPFVGQWDPGRDGFSSFGRMGWKESGERREMGHSVQWTGVYLVVAARRCSAGSKQLQV